MAIILPGDVLSYERAILESLNFVGITDNDGIDAQAEWAKQIRAALDAYKANRTKIVNSRRKLDGLNAVDTTDNPDFADYVEMQKAKERGIIAAGLLEQTRLENEVLNPLISPLDFYITGQADVAMQQRMGGDDVNGNDTV